jgi:hypothetical protein
MSLKFWDEAFLTAIFLINWLPSKVIGNETPFAQLLGQDPDYTSLRTFGCACWPNLRPYNSRKLQYRSKQCVFLGYSNFHKGFKCLDPIEGWIYISRDVVFDEHMFPFASLHPNAGTQLKSELRLLPDVLLNPSTDLGDSNLFDYTVRSPLSTNVASPVVGALLPTGLHSEEETGNSSENDGLYRMCYPGGDSTHAEVDMPGQDSGGGGASPSGSVSQSLPGGRGRGGHAAPISGAGSSVAAPPASEPLGTSASAQLDPNEASALAGTSAETGSLAAAPKSGAENSGVVIPVQADA